MRVVVTGATGYIGTRLIPELIEADHTVVAAMRRPHRAAEFRWGNDVEVAPFDVFDPASVEAVCQDADVVVYLVHSMTGDDFPARDHEAAANVAKAAGEAGVSKIVYVSGLIPGGAGDLSDHLRSRLDVEDVLSNSDVPVVVTLRAAIVLGGGSASFELVRQLSERLPFVPLPGWLDSQVQPISIADLLIAVRTAIDDIDVGASLDVGGPNRMAYSELIRLYCRVADLSRPFLPIGRLLPHRFVGAFAGRIADVPHKLVVALVDSLGHDLVVSRPVPAGFSATIPVAEAIRRSLVPTDSSDDPHVLRAHDPDWAGGDIEMTDSGPRVTGSATGGVGWRSDRIALPLLIFAAGLAIVATVRVALTRRCGRG